MLLKQNKQGHAVHFKLHLIFFLQKYAPLNFTHFVMLQRETLMYFIRMWQTCKVVHFVKKKETDTEKISYICFQSSLVGTPKVQLVRKATPNTQTATKQRADKKSFKSRPKPKWESVLRLKINGQRLFSFFNSYIIAFIIQIQKFRICHAKNKQLNIHVW